MQRAHKIFLTPTPMLQLAPVTRDVLEEATRVRATTHFKLPDAIHPATAKPGGRDSFLTKDNLFKRVKGENIKILSEMRLHF